MINGRSAGRRGSGWLGALSNVCPIEDGQEALEGRPAHVEVYW